MSRTHYQAAPAPLDEMPTLTDDGDEKSRYDFPMFFVFFYIYTVSTIPGYVCAKYICIQL